jgi:hypothetical protein
MYGSDKQLKRAILRDYRDDIETLLKTLHVVFVGREPEIDNYSLPQDTVSLFAPDLLPDVPGLKDIFRRGLGPENMRFEDVSLLRAELESCIESRAKPADDARIVELEKKLRKIGEILGELS